MIFDISTAMTWILFIALFPMAFFWLRRAFRIFVKKNYSEVAQKRGVAPANPKKWAPIVGLLNLITGSICIYVIISVVMGLYPYDTWSAIAGTTIWGKIIADLIIRMQAHPFQFGKKKNSKTNTTCTI
jgi:ABC-type phosphate transport system permease subunit